MIVNTATIVDTAMPMELPVSVMTYLTIGHQSDASTTMKGASCRMDGIAIQILWTPIAVGWVYVHLMGICVNASTRLIDRRMIVVQVT
jgi:hypothetical protein